MSEKKKKFIDLKKVIHDKNPALLKVLPSFFLHYIRTIIHEDDINRFIEENGHKYDFEFVEAILHEFKLNYKVSGLENVPSSAPCIIASNHPLGGLDAMPLMHTVSQKRKDIKFIVNDILLNLENLKNLFIPVNKHGKNSQDIIRQLDEAYSSNNAILIFPAGLVSRKQDGEVKDLEWKKSFVSRARKHERNIIPVFIDGKNSNFFYNLALLRKNIGITANLEMFYLVNEMYKQKDKTIRLIFGEPISYEYLDKRHPDQKWAQIIKEHIYNMGRTGQPISFKHV